MWTLFSRVMMGWRSQTHKHIMSHGQCREEEALPCQGSKTGSHALLQGIFQTQGSNQGLYVSCTSGCSLTLAPPGYEPAGAKLGRWLRGWRRARRCERAKERNRQDLLTAGTDRQPAVLVVGLEQKEWRTRSLGNPAWETGAS